MEASVVDQPVRTDPYLLLPTMNLDRSKSVSYRHASTKVESQRTHAVEPLSSFPVFVGRVFGNPTVPTKTGTYVSVHPVDVAGAEIEASPGSLTADTARSLLVYVIGPRPVIAGDDLICRFVGNRWVALSSTPSTGSIPCSGGRTFPSTLYLTSSRGTIPLTWVTLQAGGTAWVGCQSFTVDASANGLATTDRLGHCLGTRPGTIAVVFELFCPTGTPNLIQRWLSYNCLDNSAFYWVPSHCPAPGGPSSGLPLSDLVHPVGVQAAASNSAIANLTAGSTTFSASAPGMHTPVPITGTVTISS